MKLVKVLAAETVDELTTLTQQKCFLNLFSTSYLEKNIATRVGPIT